MAKTYKLIKNGVVQNIIHADEVESIQSQYDSIVEVVHEPIPTIKTTISESDVRNGLTLSEKVVWDTNAEPHVVTAKIEFANPLPTANAKDVLQFLVSANVISESSVNNILSGAV